MEMHFIYHSFDNPSKTYRAKNTLVSTSINTSTRILDSLCHASLVFLPKTVRGINYSARIENLMVTLVSLRRIGKQKFKSETEKRKLNIPELKRYEETII